MINTSYLLPPTAPIKTTLRISLLGPPTLMWGGQPCTIARRQARALFYRIAAATQPVPREQLGFLLWPDSPEPTARRNLTVLLTQIRAALPHPDLLVTADDTISLDHLAVETDTARLASLTAQATDTGTLDGLADGLRHYRGPFLDGFSLPHSAEFEAWVSQERQLWERRYLDALTLLVEGYTANGAYHAAIDAAQHALAIDELAENMYRHLITLYDAIGDRVAAIRQFERCVTVLERELGVDPLPETRAAYEAVRDRRYDEVETQLPRSTKGQRAQSPRLLRPSISSYLPPAPPNPLIGRSTEVNTVCAMLLNSDTRLLTLCGPGGSGKTRLALEVARETKDRFADGVLFIPLAPLHDSRRVLDVIAQTCGLHITSASGLADELRNFLTNKQLLLVLDNFEHLLPAAVDIADLLAAAPSLRILVTSRSTLHLSGEQLFPVQPLPLPKLTALLPLSDLALQPTIALLLARTRAHTPTFELTERNAADIASICICLDGLPLAIELAAARLKALSPQALLKRLDHRLSVLDRGPCDLPDRQRTLRATIEWSYRLLDSHTRQLFEQLAVFAGGWTLEAAEEIAIPDDSGSSVLDGLQTLLDSHLLLVEPSARGQQRFGMLETIREYALERLRASGAEQIVRERHAYFFCRLSELCAPGYHSAEIATVDSEYHNIRAALHWSLDRGEHELIARIISTLFWYWDTRGLLEEAHSWLIQSLPYESGFPYPWRSRVQSYSSYLAYRRGLATEAVELAATVTSDFQALPEDRALAMRVIGLSKLHTDSLANARPHFERALAFANSHGLGDAVAAAQFNLGLILLIQGELAEAETMLWESYTPWEQRRHPRYIGVALLAIGYIAVLRSEPQRASKLLQQGLQQLIIAQETTYLLYGLLACACFAALQGHSLCAATLFGAGTRHASNVQLAFIQRVLASAHRYIQQAWSESAPLTFESALQHGQSLSLDEAVALAQSVVAPGN